MFETLKRLYSEGKLTGAALENAVVRGWITQEQAREIAKFERENTAPKASLVEKGACTQEEIDGLEVAK